MADRLEKESKINQQFNNMYIGIVIVKLLICLKIKGYILTSY